MHTPTTPNHVQTAIVEAIGLLPTPLTREAAADYFDRRAAFCLDAAANAETLAQALTDDPAARESLLREAREFFAEYRRINAMRTNPV